MRLNKHISDTGHCSRREADRLIAEGRVMVNGVRARIGAEVGEGDEVLVDGQKLQIRSAAKGQSRHVYIALNKPVGITCTTESSVKYNIVDFVGDERVISGYQLIQVSLLIALATRSLNGPANGMARLISYNPTQEARIVI